MYNFLFLVLAKIRTENIDKSDTPTGPLYYRHFRDHRGRRSAGFFVFLLASQTPLSVLYRRLDDESDRSTSKRMVTLLSQTTFVSRT
jgi:hypothetical protein